METAELLERKYQTPFLHYPTLPVGAKESSKFLRAVAAFVGIDEPKDLIQKEEKRFYSYLTSLIDFLAEYRNNLPSELYSVADATYAVGFTNFMVNELGYIPKGIYITDDTPESRQGDIRKTLSALDERLGEMTTFETDGVTIQNDIKKRLRGSRRALFLGSGWEKFLAQDTGNLYTFASLPLPETVVLNRSFVGYGGGLQLIEEIYKTKFAIATTTSRTQADMGGDETLNLMCE
jgi:nitrogenase molybdenum-iron protein beta chain